MICGPCTFGAHNSCTNFSTCPCQHRTTKHMADGTIAPTSKWNELRKLQQKADEIARELEVTKEVEIVYADDTIPGKMNPEKMRRMMEGYGG